MTNVATTGAAALPQLTAGQGQEAPATTATPAAAGGALPSLTGGAAPAGTGTATTDATGATAAAGGAAPGQVPNPSDMLSKVRWLGPLAAIGGAGLAIWGFTKGKNWAKMLGIGTGMSGLMTTGLGFKAQGTKVGTEQGVLAGRQQGITELSAQVQQQLIPKMEELSTENQQLKQALQQAQTAGSGAGAGTGTPGAGTPGAGTDPGAGTGGSASGGDPAAGTDPAGAPASSGPAQAIPAAQWNPAAIVGQAVSLNVAQTAAGAVVAEAGNYVLTQPLGSGQGYASLAEADAAARGAMNTDTSGVKNFRWVVIEHAGTFHPFLAGKDANGSPTLPAENGSVAAWHALRAIDDGSLKVQWMSYDWAKDGTNRIGVFTPGGGAAASTNPGAAGGGGVGGSASTAGGAATPQTQATDAGLSAAGVTGGGPVATTTPATTSTAAVSSSSNEVGYAGARAIVGSGFTLNAATAGGAQVAGGHLQLQKLAETSVAGFATPAEAADAARLQRKAEFYPNSFQRWVTIKLDDNRFYVYKASIVSKEVPAMPASSQALHVFGNGFAQYYNGTSWVAQSDS